MLVSASSLHQQPTLGKYSQMTTSYVSSTRSEGCVEEGRIKAVERGEEERSGVEQEVKGQVRPVDVVI